MVNLVFSHLIYQIFSLSATDLLCIFCLLRYCFELLLSWKYAILKLSIIRFLHKAVVDVVAMLFYLKNLTVKSNIKYHVEVKYMKGVQRIITYLSIDLLYVQILKYVYISIHIVSRYVTLILSSLFVPIMPGSMKQ